MTSASEGGLRKSDKCRQRGGRGQKSRKNCRYHLSMAPYWLQLSKTDPSFRRCTREVFSDRFSKPLLHFPSILLQTSVHHARLPRDAHNLVVEIVQLVASDGDGVVAGAAGVEVDVPHVRVVVMAGRVEIDDRSVDRGLRVEFIRCNFSVQ